MTTIQTQCTRCSEPMTLQIDTEWMSVESAKKIAECDRCARSRGLRVPRKEQTPKPSQPELKMPYKD